MKPDQSVRILRRVNLGNYQHYEIDITISDDDENEALQRAVTLLDKAYNSLGIEEQLNVRRVKR